MKKIAAALGLVLFTSGSLFAQEQQTATEPSLTPKFGIKGGVNLSNLYVKDVKDENMKPGLNVGLFAKVPVSKGFSIQPELLYSSKGSKITYDNAVFGSGQYRFNLNYVEAPLMAVINIAPNLNLQAGGYLAYLVSSNITDMNEDGTISNIAELNADSFNRFDYGLAGGLGLDIQNFTIGARYNYGLNPIGKSGNLTGQLTNNSKNNNISLYIGFGF